MMLAEPGVCVGGGGGWPPHLLSGPQMFNSEGPTGPRDKKMSLFTLPVNDAG